MSGVINHYTCELCHRNNVNSYIYEKNIGICCEDCAFEQIELFLEKKFNNYDD